MQTKSIIPDEAAPSVQTSAHPGLSRIPLDELRESEWNPRKFHSAVAHAKLVESMRTGGWWEWSPAMARPLDAGGYELGAGHRRFRAALEAGLTDAPVIVRSMTDDEFLRVLTFDNSNHDDPHPLDEADGFRFYMEKTGCNAYVIAAEIGQSRSYVYQRLKYADLTDGARQAFMDDSISAGHAILIARLTPAEQAKALKFLGAPNWNAVYKRSVRDLVWHIRGSVLIPMEDAPFDMRSISLFPAAGPCEICPKRTRNSPELIPSEGAPEDPLAIEADGGADCCADPLCFREKTNRHVMAIKSSLIEQKTVFIEISDSYGKAKKGVVNPNGYSVVASGGSAGLIVEGHDAGKVIKIKLRGTDGDVVESKEKREADEKKRLERVSLELVFRRKILDAIRPKISALTRADAVFLVSCGLRRLSSMDGAEVEWLAAAHGLPAKNPAALRGAFSELKEPGIYQLLLEMAVIDDLRVREYNFEQKPALLLSLASRYKVDVAKIRAEVFPGAAVTKPPAKEKAAAVKKAKVRVKAPAKKKKARK